MQVHLSLIRWVALPPSLKPLFHYRRLYYSSGFTLRISETVGVVCSVDTARRRREARKCLSGIHLARGNSSYVPSLAQLIELFI